MEHYIRELFTDPDMLRMGHDQRKEDLNLGLGWIYYALGRLVKPSCSVVIGSFRGFAPSVFAKAMLDNVEQGELVFIDPSLVDDFWADAEAVTDYFGQLGTPNVKHYRYTTQDFIETNHYHGLSEVGLLMIDGYHTAEQARLDYLAFIGKLSDQAIVLFHDSMYPTTSKLYGKDNIYEHSVFRLIERLKQTPGLQTFTLPFGQGITLVQGIPESLDIINTPFD